MIGPRGPYEIPGTPSRSGSETYQGRLLSATLGSLELGPKKGRGREQRIFGTRRPSDAQTGGHGWLSNPTYGTDVHSQRRSSP